MPSLTDVGADLRAGSSSVAAAGVALSSAGSSVQELLSSARAMQLDAVATRLAEFLARVSELTEATADVQRSLQAALAATTPSTGGSGPAPGSSRSRPRVTGELGRLKPEEQAVVDDLVDRGAEVEILVENHGEHGLKNPDARVRWSEREAWVVTEFKSLGSGTSTAVKNNIIAAGKQVAARGGGDVVIDTRGVDIDLATIETGYARARGQAAEFGQPLPDRVHVILTNGRRIILDRGRTT